VQKRFEAHCKKETMIDADLRSSVYSIALKHGNEATLDAVEKLFREADLHEERVRLMRCMGSVSQPELISRVLKFALSVGANYLLDIENFTTAIHLFQKKLLERQEIAHLL
jgi:hypothetical protein